MPPRPYHHTIAGLLLAFALPSLPAQTAPPPPSEALMLERLMVTPSHFNLTEAGAGSLSSLTRRDLEILPQVGEDLFRSIARLPGVTADDFTAKFWKNHKGSGCPFPPEELKLGAENGVVA
ncbi:MAG: hypothetical protein ABIY47_05265 [Opitutaceae bacterium]